MRCQEIQQRLDDFLAGALVPGEMEKCSQHLGQCAECQQALTDLQAILEMAAELPREVQPARDLWPDVLARIDQEPAAGRAWWLQWAAAGIALAMLSVPLSVWWAGQKDGDKPAVAQFETVGDRVADQAQVARSEDGVLLARTDLITAIERRRDVVEDETFQVLEHNMVLLDRAIGELRVALEEDPQNLRLRMLLASRYQQERKLLQKVSRV